MHFSLSKKLIVLIVFLASLYYAVPNFLTAEQREKLSPFVADKTINLGLDLQGGSHMVLEVDMNDVTTRAYDNLEEDIRRVRGSGKERQFGTRGLKAMNDSVVFSTLPTEVGKAEEVLKKELQDVDVERQENRFILRFTVERLDEMRQQAMEQTLEVLRSRVDEFGVSEPLLQRQGDSRIIIELPGVESTERAKSVIGRTAQLTFHLVDEALSAMDARRNPSKVVMYETNYGPNGEEYKIPYVLDKRPLLTGENLAGASSGFDQNGEHSVSITFDGVGTRKFGKITTDYVGRRLAIVLDGEVYSAPSLREPILGGTASITGNFTSQDAKDLATILRAGALPATVNMAEERTIGPSLGQDSIEAGKLAVIAGFCAVLAIMLLCYHMFGLVANMALLFNVVLIVAIMTALGATLTLPGIAGIVLTIGMAVDANVLIFERIREERLKNVKVPVAMEDGFKSAFTTILDANITTLIVAIVLFAVGSGPIKGFALTLSVGILASMFTAIIVTRMLLIAWYNLRKPEKIGGAL